MLYNTLHRKAKTAYNTLFKEGVLSFVCLTLRRIFPMPNPFLFWNRWILMDSCGVNPAVIRRDVSEDVFCIATEEDHRQLDLHFPNKKKAHDLARREGDDCIIVKTGEKIVAFAWLKYGEYYYIFCGMKTIPRGKYARGYNFFIVPEHRGANTFVELNVFCHEVLRLKGYSGMTFEVGYNNQRSRRSFARIGGKINEIVYFVSILGFKLYFRKGSGYLKPQARWTYDVHARMVLE